ncbi:MAG: substrate-binding domain-containing protein [Armatimonadota bacterium]|nr:substrate-binding domain-containing protein [Armatimonadota bacterium]MDR7439997.1 substrate-binding domain-containing protein [Armatimonadota bacterium]MDR7562949.1 substrate-binding domain-containing protein [Armatimonadota bacterium]MDR7568272.1 substrate-binding domain-containing protein [Armatimonadota bacterium]MDR7601871.1 substrate-binding domain-containing protein [Armatimonadota bacterium]
MRYRWHVVGIVLSLSLILASAPDLIAQPDVVQAARQEGKVVVYVAMREPIFNVVKKIYEGRYGVQVEEWRSSASGILDRVLTETRVGRWLFDVAEGTTETMQVLRDAGAIGRGPWPSIEGLTIPWRDPTIPPPYRVIADAVIYNPRMVSAAEVPRSYLDLIDPKWRGKIVMADPQRNVTIALWLHWLRGVLGRDYDRFLRGFAEQNPAFVGMDPLVPPKVISGEYPLGITLLHYVPLFRAQGAPIDYARINPMMAVGAHFAVSARPPHPNAARLLMETLHSRAALLAIAQEGEAVLVRGVKSAIPGVEQIRFQVAQPLGAEQLREWRRELERLFARR